MLIKPVTVGKTNDETIMRGKIWLDIKPYSNVFLIFFPPESQNLFKQNNDTGIPQQLKKCTNKLAFAYKISYKGRHLHHNHKLHQIRKNKCL